MLHWQLYAKKTNPNLEKVKVIFFSNFNMRKISQNSNKISNPLNFPQELRKKKNRNKHLTQRVVNIIGMTHAF
jgi:hypothetical protein